MKATTKYWIGVRHVGDSEWVDRVEELSAADMVRMFMGVLAEVNLARRIDVAVARTEEEVRKRLEERVTSPVRKKVDLDADLLADFDRLWAEVEGEPQAEESR